MKKESIIESVAQVAKLSRKDAAKAVSTTLQAIGNALAHDGECELSGFGKFCVKSVKERSGRNPRTGEAMTIAAHKRIVFKAFTDLQNKIKK